MSETEILLSFIIPVYNVESYLKECINSILQYMTDECEIILVNDGSTDKSRDICEQYSDNDFRIKTVNKDNGGLSSARNVGMSVAKGKYITFVDSDDKIYPDSLIDILNWIKESKTDLCFLSAYKYFQDGKLIDLGESIVKSELILQNKEKAIHYLASRPKYPGSAWAKLYRRDFLNKNNLHFPYDRRFSEDLGFIRDCILCAENFDFLDIPYYQYRCKRQGSITNSVTSKNFNDLLIFVEESIEMLTVNNMPKDSISKSALGFVAYEYTILLYLYNLLSVKEKNDAFIKLKDYKWTLKYAVNKKSKFVYFICSLCGIKFTAYLMKQYRRATEA